MCIPTVQHSYILILNSSNVLTWSRSGSVLQNVPEQTKQVFIVKDESPTCAEFGKNLHGVIKSLLAKQIEGIEILDVMYLLLLITVWIILHLLARKKNQTKNITKKFIIAKCPKIARLQECKNPHEWLFLFLEMPLEKLDCLIGWPWSTKLWVFYCFNVLLLIKISDFYVPSSELKHKLNLQEFNNKV